MTVKSVPADIFDSSDLENPGWYNWRVAAPGEVVPKDEYKGGEPTERTYSALSTFLIAQEVAIFDEDGMLTGSEKPVGVSMNCNFKLTKPDENPEPEKPKYDKKGLAKLKSLYIVNTGKSPRTVIEEVTGEKKYDFPAIGQEIADFTGWCAVVHGTDQVTGKKFQYLQGNFRKNAPEKVKV